MDFGVGKCLGLQELRSSKAKEGIDKAGGEPTAGRAGGEQRASGKHNCCGKLPF